MFGEGEREMGIIFLVILGAVLGWLAGLISGSGSGRAVILAILAGIASALISGLALPPLLGYSPLIIDSQYSSPSVIIAFVGTFVLLALSSVMLRRQ